MSVYTNIIVHFEGTGNEFKNVVSPNFDEWDHHVEVICPHYYRFYHPECDLDELRVTIERIANHRRCKDIWSEITWQYKKTN